MMRQAGRYHQHYQKLRSKHSFVELCKVPELAAQVALGPIEDFDFDVAILFSDILFPLEALGMGLEYTDHGPRLAWTLAQKGTAGFTSHEEALSKLMFQRQAMQETRRLLPLSKSLIGFVGGPWTLFGYAVQGKHEGGLLETKKHLFLWDEFCAVLLPLLKDNIRLQFEGGAELVMVFDTAAGELSPDVYQSRIVPKLRELAEALPSRLGYYARGTTAAHHDHERIPWAGEGRDHRWDLAALLKAPRQNSFLQGNFDQTLLHQRGEDFKMSLDQWLAPLRQLSATERSGWVCGLGHGVLPKTPESHVRYFVDHVRNCFSK
jgi:uroporphyrinogen decarboxylase